MKVALLSNARATHIIRWANGLANRDIKVHLISTCLPVEQLDHQVELHLLPVQPPLGHIVNASVLSHMLQKLKPDLLNAHYAAGYGLLARLCKYKPLLLSVWGSDIYVFPRKSILHRWLVKNNLQNSTAVASTSMCMAQEITKTFPHQHLFLTPFGVDQNVFFPVQRDPSDGDIVIGTVKKLAPAYGIDTLIQAFAKIVADLGDMVPLRLEITGDGPDRQLLHGLANQLGVGDKVIFHGSVEHSQVPTMLHRLDIYAALSRSESFGVAILEANACQKPVVVSDADGPAEVTIPNITGFVVPKDDPVAASDALIKLIKNTSLREKMGKAGRKHVLEKYTWDNSLNIMIETYRQTIAHHKTGNLKGLHGSRENGVAVK